MSDNVNDWLMSGGTPWARFDTPGDTVEGDIVGTPVMRQARDFDTGTPATWPDGNPIMEAVVTLRTEQRSEEYEDDEGLRLFVVNSTNKRAALRSAITKAKAKGLEPGGRLWVRYTGDGPATGRGRQGPKLYQIAYKPAPFDPGTADGPETREVGTTDQRGPAPAPRRPWQQEYSDPPF